MVTRHLSTSPGVRSVVGVDPSDYLLEDAREKGGENIEYRQGTALDIPVEDVKYQTQDHRPEPDYCRKV